jgi:exportin-1
LFDRNITIINHLHHPDEEDEWNFLVNIIRDLLSLVDRKTQQEPKAVVATDIMFIVSQYPRFLRAHWKFLRTVSSKLIEFMRETFCGLS